MNIVVLGSSGMLGNSIYKNLTKLGHSVFGFQRSKTNSPNIIDGLDISDLESIELTLKKLAPEIVINCIGIIKQASAVEDVVNTLAINSQLPHQLAKICKSTGSKLIHFSTDCIFDGATGNYLDDDDVSAKDTYGLSKYLGEIRNQNHVLTIRTSIIGHGIEPNNSLVDWFMMQEESVSGYSEAYFSGLPCSEISEVLDSYIIKSDLYGLYNLSVDRISKFELLKLIKDEYDLDVEIIKYDGFKIDRSLDSTRFRKETGFKVKPWKQLIKEMKERDFNR
ncbi:dTDP-4-dehydrorhamnose reductase family protein [Vibrio vulnificus]|uniref:dTDP-4-dehydrorhamnose reductase family protein n=1 Tax=Vibrio vulnificus TaxID=672 RepID=UPI001A1C258C|nr:SDR family oxidoreductase [Vibrio vulnificus]MDS1828739.1 SDR family oxidoreductase [Vibrio vulnificus]HAS8319004.1 SDR family oxidoreductase [Vibrio vulnificus]